MRGFKTTVSFMSLSFYGFLQFGKFSGRDESTGEEESGKTGGGDEMER